MSVQQSIDDFVGVGPVGTEELPAPSECMCDSISDGICVGGDMKCRDCMKEIWKSDYRNMNGGGK